MQIAPSPLQPIVRCQGCVCFHFEAAHLQYDPCPFNSTPWIAQKRHRLFLKSCRRDSMPAGASQPLAGTCVSGRLSGPARRLLLQRSGCCELQFPAASVSPQCPGSLQTAPFCRCDPPHYRQRRGLATSLACPGNTKLEPSESSTSGQHPGCLMLCAPLQ